MPINFDLTKHLNPVFIETGFYRGKGVQLAIKAGFKKIYSIDSDRQQVMVGRKQFQKFGDRVTLILGDSDKMLGEVLNGVDTACTFWLDAHGSDTSPILRELKQIKLHGRTDHTIMIDDLRVFHLWGVDRADVEKALLDINPDYEISTATGWHGLQDVLMATPPKKAPVDCTGFVTRELVLEMAVRTAHQIRGSIVEFGVAKGASTRVLREALTHCERGQTSAERKKIFACDSFEGLPQKFENAEVGTFACQPPEIDGVEIVHGYFEDSLTEQLARRVCSVSLASLDADLFDSTLCALRWLASLLHDGSLLLFDEFTGGGGQEQRAFEQWSEESGIRTMLVAGFVREPSGWGTKLDKRMLFQVVIP